MSDGFVANSFAKLFLPPRPRLRNGEPPPPRQTQLFSLLLISIVDGVGRLLLAASSQSPTSPVPSPETPTKRRPCGGTNTKTAQYGGLSNQNRVFGVLIYSISFYRAHRGMLSKTIPTPI